MVVSISASGVELRIHITNEALIQPLQLFFCISESSVDPSIRSHIGWLEWELKDLDRDLRSALRRSPVWREKDDLLRSVGGAGEQLSLSLLAYLSELGTINRKRIAALVGVAPFRSSSGQAERLGRQNAATRGALHGCARRHSVQSGAPGHLPTTVAAGKPKKLALTACMRKLLTILNAMVKTGRHWTPKVNST